MGKSKFILILALERSAWTTEHFQQQHQSVELKFPELFEVNFSIGHKELLVHSS